MMASRDSTTFGPSPRRTWNVRKADSREDAYYLVRQWHHYFGVEYGANRLPTALAEIAGWTGEDDGVEVCGVIATHDDGENSVRIGGGVAQLFDADEMVTELPDGMFDKSMLVGNRNAMLWFGAVDPAWRGHGIGRRLFEERLRWADAYGAHMAFGFGWNRPDGRTSWQLFDGYGFHPVQEFEDYYARPESTRDACPDCGVWPSDENPCECGMTLWARDLPMGGSK